MKKWRVRERTFKRLSFATTIVGVVLMAVGLQQLLLTRDVVFGVFLLVLGLAVALTSVVLEVVPEPGFVITLYTREACSLCDAARAFLIGKRREYDYDLWEVDVDKDAEANARYSDWVPVAVASVDARRRGRGRGGIVGDEELFRAVPDYARLEQKLRALADARVRR